MSIPSGSWAAAIGGAACAAVAFSFERAVRLFPWRRVEEIEDRPKRQRMELSLEHADQITTVCVFVGCVGLVVMTLGIADVVDGLWGATGAPGWLLYLSAAVAVALCCLVIPEVVARYRPDPIVGVWLPLIARLVLMTPLASPGPNGDPQAEGESDGEADSADDEAREFYRSVLRLQIVAVIKENPPRHIYILLSSVPHRLEGPYESFQGFNLYYWV